jgi:hypothetical protein
MNVPGFSAEASLYSSGGYTRHGQIAVSPAGAIVPAIPPCRNCHYILSNCEKLGHYSAACAYCQIGYCDPSPAGIS